MEFNPIQYLGLKTEQIRTVLFPISVYPSNHSCNFLDLFVRLGNLIEIGVIYHVKEFLLETSLIGYNLYFFIR